MKIIVTGAAGFIGAAVAEFLLKKNFEVVGVDNINEYYDITLKKSRLKNLSLYEKFTFIQVDLKDYKKVSDIFQKHKIDRVLHLAAQAGVRYSLENPFSYVDSNLVSFFNILEACRQFDIKHFVFASSSSVYGGNTKLPFSTSDSADKPLNLYAATKRSDELLAYSYSHLYRISTIGLRYFTVYGPWGRPDMSPFIFLKKIIDNQPINVFNYGHHQRDYTYIDDIVNGTFLCLNKIINNSESAPCKVYNIGYGKPIKILDFIKLIENYAGKKAKINLLPMQPGEVESTWSDITDLQQDLGYHPSTPIEIGIKKFVDWYLSFYQPKSSFK